VRLIVYHVSVNVYKLRKCVIYKSVECLWPGGGGYSWNKKPEPERNHSPLSSAAISNLFTPRNSPELARLRWGLPTTLCSANISRFTCTCTQRKGVRLYVGLCLWDSNECAVKSAVRVAPHLSTLRVTEDASAQYTDTLGPHLDLCTSVADLFMVFVSIRTNTRILHQIRPLPLPYASSTVLYPLTVLQFDSAMRN
jgi:hypothetical protein